MYFEINYSIAGESVLRAVEGVPTPSDESADTDGPSSSACDCDAVFARGPVYGLPSCSWLDRRR